MSRLRFLIPLIFFHFNTSSRVDGFMFMTTASFIVSFEMVFLTNAFEIRFRRIDCADDAIQEQYTLDASSSHSFIRDDLQSSDDHEPTAAHFIALSRIKNV